jgi:hypothetical protein
LILVSGKELGLRVERQKSKEQASEGLAYGKERLGYGDAA